MRMNWQLATDHWLLSQAPQPNKAVAVWKLENAKQTRTYLQSACIRVYLRFQSEIGNRKLEIPYFPKSAFRNPKSAIPPPHSSDTPPK